jgi:hypothetical protein
MLGRVRNIGTEQIQNLIVEDESGAQYSLNYSHRKKAIENKLVDSGKLIEFERIPYCPNYDGKHWGKDCNCKSGFIYIARLLKVDPIVTRSNQIDLLEEYSNFLEKHGYLDTDWREEEPFAIDEFLKQHNQGASANL